MFSSRSFFFGFSVLACVSVSSVLSVPESDYADWFSRRDDHYGNGSSSSLPPLPGSGPSGKNLKKCVFESVLAIEEKDSVVLLDETLVVDGCLLDCNFKILHSTVRDGSIVTVRNGGRVRNCKVTLIKEKQLKNELEKIDALDNIILDQEDYDEDETSGTVPPTMWGSYANTMDSSPGVTYFATYFEKYTKYIPNTVSGFVCDQGDCVLEDSSCVSLEIDGKNPPSSILIMRECVLVSKGAADVRIQGGLTSYNGPISLFGIAVDAANHPEEGSSSEIENKKADARLFLDNAIIRNQLVDGIVIVGGASTVRITDCSIHSNKRDGINIYGGRGLLSFAVIRGTVEYNAKRGIFVLQYELQSNSTQYGDGGGVPVLKPTTTEVLISDVLVKLNGEDGLKVERTDDVIIDGAIFEENQFNGIDIMSASTISLQGVISDYNAQNGLSVEAEGSTLEIANSVFVGNGKGLPGTKQAWKKAGVYIWLPEKVTITNSASNWNDMDGVLVYDVNNLNLTSVDAMWNGNNGIHVRENGAAYKYDYTANSDYLVGAYYYPWHGEDFHNGGGYLRKELTPPQSPELGEYDDSDPAVISKHLEYFRKSNIGLLVASWWGPDRIEDYNIRNILMQHEYIGNLKIALHYETTGRIKKEAGHDMSVPDADIQYMCDHYFDHPNYYKINGRPVLVIYISRKLEQLGTLESAVSTMRSAASKCGHDLYLIGDAVFAKAPEINDDEPFLSFRYFDAVTNYDVYGSSGASERDTPFAGKENVDAFYAEQEKWRTLALKENCRYIPPVSPGYNDRGVRLEKNHPPLSRRLVDSDEEGSLFKYQLEKALPLVDPEVDNLILVNSFNEWHEDTQIEPAAVVYNSTEPAGYNATKLEELTFGLEYVDYGDLYLDILRNATSKPFNKHTGPGLVYKPSEVEFTDVHSCKNKASGMRFYITENSYDEQPEFVFKPGRGVGSCKNKMFDYQLLGGGNLNIKSKSSVGITGEKCANGREALECSFSNILKSCKRKFCRQRDIITTSGNVINDHKLQ